MKKAKDEGVEIDFDNLGKEAEDAIVTAVKAVAEYMGEARQVRESMAETLDSLAADMKANKDSTKKLKKMVRKLAKTYVAQDGDVVKEENELFERLLEKVEKNK